MSTTLIHLMKMATANNVIISFRPTHHHDRGYIRFVDAAETDPTKVLKIERMFDFRAFNSLLQADEMSMLEFSRAIVNLCQACGRKYIDP